MNHFLLLSLLLALCTPAFSQITINEVLTDPVGTDAGAEKIEIANLGTSLVDLTGYDLYPDGIGYFTFPSFTLSAGSVVVIHLRQSGTNSATDLYHANPTDPTANMGNSVGSVALFSSTTHNSSTIVSFVQWGSGSQTWASAGVSAGVWVSAADFVPGIVEGHSLEYDGSGNTPSDWFDQSTPTLGVSNSLPVQMAGFTVEGGSRDAEVRWRTENEVENYGFEIERRMVQGSMFQVQSSMPGNLKPETWKPVVFVQGFGTSSGPREYSFIDRNLSPGRYAYRIRQIDHSGSFAFTEAVEVDVGLAPREFTLGQNYPNPFNPTTTIEFTLPRDGRVLMKVYNILGEDVGTVLDEERTAGRIQHVIFDAGGLSGGVYVVRLSFAGWELARKIILLK